MRSSRQKSSISKLDLDQFVFTPPGSMGWQAHDSISAEKEEEEMHLAAGSIRELPNINAPNEYQEEKKKKETDREVTDDDEATKFETVREPEKERASKRSTPRVEEEEEKEKETDREVTDDEATKFETVREPEEERASKRSAPPVEEEEEEEEPEQMEDDRVEVIILPSDSAPAPWVSNAVKRKA